MSIEPLNPDEYLGTPQHLEDLVKAVELALPDVQAKIDGKESLWNNGETYDWAQDEQGKAIAIHSSDAVCFCLEGLIARNMPYVKGKTNNEKSVPFGMFKPFISGPSAVVDNDLYLYNEEEPTKVRDILVKFLEENNNV